MRPQSLIEEVEKRYRRHLWGDTEDQREMHHGAWKDLSWNKCIGGLNIRTSAVRNKAAAEKPYLLPDRGGNKRMG